MFTITAQNMLTAQATKLSPAAEAELTAIAARRRAWDEEDLGPEVISVPVHDFAGALIGHLAYTR